MIEIPFEGGCRCQTIRYQCSAAPFVAYTCHCLECQKITSSAFATCIHVPVESFTVITGSPSANERISDAGNRLTTSFCGSCGSALVVDNSARPRMRTVMVGTLDRAQDIEVSAHIWTSRRLPWVMLPADHRIFEKGGDWRPDYAHDPTRLEG
ncbi:MAG: GFA family protein [Candidatus Competibacteraceae bacterium]|nr:GFA family protein [Candidatus Competibacteraceae bacterium]